MRKFFCILFSLLIFLPGISYSEELPENALLEKAKQLNGPRYEYALQEGARIGLTPEGKSFYVMWLPEGADPQNPPPMVVTLSGHSGWAFNDFFVWHSFLEKRGYGFLSIQWWLGEGESLRDYLIPREIYRAVDSVLQSMNVRAGTVLLHGFSRGSTNTYTLTAMDRNSQKNYFALTVANAGKANSNYPPVHDVESGIYGKLPLEGTRWVTYGGGKDPHPERDGIQGMREAGAWIEKYGGKVILAIEDPQGDHGGFHRNPVNAEKALDVFEELRAK